jgi:hypothetical protein
MYVALRLRSELLLQDLCNDFHDRDFLLLPFGDSDSAEMAQRALTTPDLRNYHSTASAPSLRSREPLPASMERPYTPDGDAGNVKVVVRCRKFVKRGKDMLEVQYNGTCTNGLPQR